MTNQFLDCEAYVSEHGTGCGVRSKYWNIPAQNEADAQKIAEVVQNAYKAGRADVQQQIKKALDY
jgi:hypothetical protein